MSAHPCARSRWNGRSHTLNLESEGRPTNPLFLRPSLNPKSFTPLSGFLLVFNAGFLYRAPVRPEKPAAPSGCEAGRQLLSGQLAQRRRPFSFSGPVSGSQKPSRFFFFLGGGGLGLIRFLQVLIGVYMGFRASGLRIWGLMGFYKRHIMGS